MPKEPAMPIDFAILAPVPLEHLRSGSAVAETLGYVCFGSQKFELFREIEKLRDHDPVPVLIYPSYEGEDAKPDYRIAWLGWYLGCIEDTGEKRREEHTGHRPPTTARHAPQDSSSGWAVFWRVHGLREIPREFQAAITQLSSLRTGERRMEAPPRGPELVKRPAWI
jgi:hypothetical protein